MINATRPAVMRAPHFAAFSRNSLQSFTVVFTRDSCFLLTAALLYQQFAEQTNRPSLPSSHGFLALRQAACGSGLYILEPPIILRVHANGRRAVVNGSVLNIPGIANSGPLHWQTLWEASDHSISRLKVDDWDHPVCRDWLAAIDAQATSARQPLVVVAHSLGCLAFACWAAQCQRNIHGALLVAIPDVNGPNFPPEATGFSLPARLRLPYKSIVVASENDPYGSLEYAKSCAAAWGSHFVDMGKAGHINAASNLADWPAGLKLLEELRS
jgi:predicted alpha/beta hydrolase family esterase